MPASIIAGLIAPKAHEVVEAMGLNSYQTGDPRYPSDYSIENTRQEELLRRLVVYCDDVRNKMDGVDAIGAEFKTGGILSVRVDPTKTYATPQEFYSALLDIALKLVGDRPRVYDENDPVLKILRDRTGYGRREMAPNSAHDRLRLRIPIQTNFHPSVKTMDIHLTQDHVAFPTDIYVHRNGNVHLSDRDALLVPNVFAYDALDSVLEELYDMRFREGQQRPQFPVIRGGQSSDIEGPDTDGSHSPTGRGSRGRGEKPRSAEG
ncbi:MAG: hypothetical protein HYS80_01635 [Candidatus Aenigmarchaeota archaeon]|nr:hypothetical protein [Candidatus Aenigmarchaeota archaeon]